MNEAEILRRTIDLILWADPEKVRTIWLFVSNYLKDEKVGIHVDDDYLIAHADYLKAKRRKAKKNATKMQKEAG